MVSSAHSCDGDGLIIKNRVEDVDLPVTHPKKSFMVGALEKEIRLSFAQRIRGTLPDPYQPLLSEGKEKETPDFKYELDSKYRGHFTSSEEWHANIC